MSDRIDFTPLPDHDPAEVERVARLPHDAAIEFALNQGDAYEPIPEFDRLRPLSRDMYRHAAGRVIRHFAASGGAGRGG